MDNSIVNYSVQRKTLKFSFPLPLLLVRLSLNGNTSLMHFKVFALVGCWAALVDTKLSTRAMKYSKRSKTIRTAVKA